MTLGEEVYFWTRAVVIVVGLALQLAVWVFLASWFASSQGVDLRRRREASWNWREILPGPAGRRARVERKHLKIRAPTYKRRVVKVERRRFFPLRLNRRVPK